MDKTLILNASLGTPTHSFMNTLHICPLSTCAENGGPRGAEGLTDDNQERGQYHIATKQDRARMPRKRFCRRKTSRCRQHETRMTTPQSCLLGLWSSAPPPPTP